MGQDDLTVWHYVPVGLGLFGGQLLTLGGALGPAHLLHLGAVFTLVGWGTGLLYLLRMLWRDGGKTWHAVSCAGALFLGFVGLLAYAGRSEERRVGNECVSPCRSRGSRYI